MIDSHAHLSSREFRLKEEEVIVRSVQAGVKKIINICTDRDSFERGIELARLYPEVLNAAATTPHDVEKEGEEMFEVFAKAAREGQLCAIGETGLDYHYEHSDRRVQEQFLRRYFALAKEVKLPTIIHCREAFTDLFRISDECYVNQPLVVHCFTGGVQEAKEACDRGWMLSFSGIVTFKKSEALREVVRFVPSDRILVETDAPYLAPQSHRGELCESAYVIETAECIARVRNSKREEMFEILRRNTEQFFSISV